MLEEAFHHIAHHALYARPLSTRLWITKTGCFNSFPHNPIVHACVAFKFLRVCLHKIHAYHYIYYIYISGVCVCVCSFATHSYVKCVALYVYNILRISEQHPFWLDGLLYFVPLARDELTPNTNEWIPYRPRQLIKTI